MASLRFNLSYWYAVHSKGQTELFNGQWIQFVNNVLIKYSHSEAEFARFNSKTEAENWLLVKTSQPKPDRNTPANMGQEGYPKFPLYHQTQSINHQSQPINRQSPSIYQHTSPLSPIVEKSTQVYTDGSYLANLNQAGWALVIVTNNKISAAYAGKVALDKETNNTAELTAIYMAIHMVDNKQIDRQCTVFSDSLYAINSVTKWCKKWKTNGWKTAKGQAVKNADLIKTIVNSHQHQPDIDIKHIKAHNGNQYNELADSLAKQAATAAANPGEWWKCQV